jgi:glycosyltransferase involved in cell wall biosynthesis
VPGSRLPTTSVVILTHDRRAHLRRAIAAALRDPGAAEVVVVVNGSTDGSLELVEAMARREPRLKPLALDRRGVGSSREAGIRAASGEVVLTLDDDVIAGPGLVSGHARAHAGRDDLVVMGHMPLSARALRAGGLPARLYSEWYEGEVRSWEQDPGAVLRGLWGGNVSLRRERALAVPPGSPAFTAPRNQDRDWGLRLLKAGMRGRFDRALRAEHDYSRSLPQLLRDQAGAGHGTWLVHALHADVLGPLPQDHYFRGLPPAPARLVRLARRRRSDRLVRAAGTLALAGERLAPSAAEVADVAIRMAQQRAALEASRAI